MFLSLPACKMLSLNWPSEILVLAFTSAVNPSNVTTLWFGKSAILW